MSEIIPISIEEKMQQPIIINNETAPASVLDTKKNVSSKPKRKFIIVPKSGIEPVSLTVPVVNTDTSYADVANKTLKERVEWAVKKPDNVVKNKDVTIKQQKEKLSSDEKKWGNDMIGQKNNGQWTTLLGECLVRDVLQLRGENPRKPELKGGFRPDWETDEFIYEVKTSNWWVDGTAGEKVLGTFIKYQNIPELYGKPLRIVCVANQEEELINGKTVYFGENITKKTQELLKIARLWNIEYVKFSDLVLPVMSKIYA